DSLTEESFEITSFKHNKIKGNISLKNAKMLFFTIPYDKGWRIFVNGEKKKLHRVNIGFSGIYLKQGEHEIILVYKPLYFELTLAISIISILIFILLAIKFRNKKL
ncbi:MAG: YfhO family protein, partial [Bacteroidota bacterium]|nr:YfhO family protein [Bacteroidota bacterium]